MNESLESKPMKQHELGRYVCVAHGGCLHRHRTIREDGVWVRRPDSLNPGGHLYSSAHRDCFKAEQARKRLEDLGMRPEDIGAALAAAHEQAALEDQTRLWWGAPTTGISEQEN